MSAFLLAAFILVAGFAILWWRCSQLNNYSFVDAWWAFGIGFCALFYAVVGQGDFFKSLIIGLLAACWSIRLGGHLLRRIRRHHPVEDSRYQKLREVWAGRVKRSFFWFFQAQAFLVLLLSMPFLLISRDNGGWGVWEAMGLLVFAIGLGGESLADAQMASFKKSGAENSAICQEGLWSYSRHPNYFFEFVVWLGFYFFACGSEWGWVTVFAPGLILFLLLKVTGIPPTEASAVARKGDAYRDYQRSTSAFVPLPPRKN